MEKSLLTASAIGDLFTEQLSLNFDKNSVLAGTTFLTTKRAFSNTKYVIGSQLITAGILRLGMKRGMQKWPWEFRGAVPIELS